MCISSLEWRNLVSEGLTRTPRGGAPCILMPAHARTLTAMHAKGARTFARKNACTQVGQ